MYLINIIDKQMYLMHIKEVIIKLEFGVPFAN